MAEHRSQKRFAVQFLIDKLETRGLSREELRRMPVFEGISFSDDNVSMTLKNYLTFFNEAAVWCNDPCLGLHIGAETDVQDFGYIGLLVHHSATLRDSWLAFARYLSIIFPEMILQFEEGPTTSRIDYDVLSYTVDESRQDIDMSLAALVRLFRTYINEDWSPTEIYLKHDDAENADEFIQFFGSDVRFNQPTSSIFFDSTALDIKVSDTDPQLLRIIREHADELLANVSRRDNIVSSVRYHIASTIGSDLCKSEIVASKLFLSQRTLKRQLANLDTSFRQLKLDVVEDIAKRSLVATSTSVSEIAMNLGYSETAAFDRTFKKITGYTPTAYRKMAASHSV